MVVGPWVEPRCMVVVDQADSKELPSHRERDAAKSRKGDTCLGVPCHPGTSR